MRPALVNPRPKARLVGQVADGPSTRSRLLIVNSTLHIGGAEIVAARLAQYVSRQLFDPMACYLKEPGLVADQMVETGVKLVPVPGLKQGTRDYLTFLKLRKLIITKKIGIIHTHDIHGMIDGAACRLTTPGLRFVHTFHFGNYPNRAPRHKCIEKSLWRTADALVAVSHSQARAIRALYGIPDDRLRVIWNGIDRPTDTNADPAHNWKVPVIASISTLIPQKGIEYLLEAASLLQARGEQFVLLIAGEGHLRERLRQLATSLRLEPHVHFLGWVPRASRDLLPKCDIFVQSSLWEAMSIVVLEAMAAGKPMVVTAVGENSQVLKSGMSGILVPPANPVALADAIQLLLRDPSLRQRLGLAAQHQYEQQFTMRQMVSEYEKVYGGLSRTR